MIAFVINVYDDQHLAIRLANQILHHYQQKPIVIGDGVDIAPELSAISQSYSFERVKQLKSGLWTHRYLEIALSTPATHIIKLDPDSCLWRPFTLSDADWFGSLSSQGEFVRGGGFGLRRNVAEKIVDSQFLKHSFPFIYYRYSVHKWPHETFSDKPISNQDNITKLVMRKLGIKPTIWPEVLVHGNDGKIPEPGNYAITHPHPTL